jgi:restriction endonuclease Mrr
VLADAGGEATSAHVQDALAKVFELPAPAREGAVEIAPRKRVNRWDRHVRWTQQRARHAGLTISPAEGVWRLYPAGENALGNQERMVRPKPSTKRIFESL